jgi:hypothetical protein
MKFADRESPKPAYFGKLKKNSAGLTEALFHPDVEDHLIVSERMWNKQLGKSSVQLRDSSVRLGSFLENKSGKRLPVTRDASGLPTVRVLFQHEYPDSWDTAEPVLPRSTLSDNWRMAAVRTLTSFKGGITEDGDWDEDYSDHGEEEDDTDPEFVSRMNSVACGLDRSIAAQCNLIEATYT